MVIERQALRAAIIEACLEESEDWYGDDGGPMSRFEGENIAEGALKRLGIQPPPQWRALTPGWTVRRENETR